MKQLTYHPAANQEIDKAYTWYAFRSAKSADGFYEELLVAVKRVNRQPYIFPQYFHGTRRVVLNHYPFSVVFRELPRKIQIIALAHAKRHPDYWANRL